MPKTTVPRTIAAAVHRMIADESSLAVTREHVEDVLRRNGSSLLYRWIERGPNNMDVRQDILRAAGVLAPQRTIIRRGTDVSQSVLAE